MEVVLNKNNIDGMPNLQSVEILGVRVNNVTIEKTLSIIETMVKNGNHHQIIPVNPEMIMVAQKNKLFRDTLNKASLILPDGIGVIAASWIMGKGIQGRVTGVDTVKQIAAKAQHQGFRLFLLGAAPSVAEQAAQKLKSEFHGLEIAGMYAGSPHPDEEDTICGKINAARPHILLVAYGAPKQELWVARNIHRLNVPVVMCVGGTFDFIAGVSRRAPIWIQKLGLEWFYRLAREPHRWRRMLALPKFAVAVIQYRVRMVSYKENLS